MATCTVKFEHFAILLTAAMIWWLFRCLLLNDCPVTIFDATKAKSSQMQVLKPGPNTVSYLYVVGVEGVGHHGVSPAIAEIAKACKRTVMYEYSPLRRSHKAQNKKNLAYFLRKLRNLRSSTRKMQVIEDSSFPAGPYWRNSTSDQKKSYNPYNLVWLYEQLKRSRGVDMNFLYLSRDFYRTVASHPEFDGSFAEHAAVLHDFIWFLHDEYKTINSKTPDLWRQVSYEWFTEMKNCTSLVSSVVQFTGWQDCDISLACSKMNETILPPRAKEVNLTDLALARSMNTMLPIPFLEYDP